MTATTTSKSVYDRLYKANTASSKHRKEVAAVIPKNILTRENEEPTTNKSSIRKEGSKIVRPRKVTKPLSDKGDVFNRLYSKGTASSISKTRSEHVNSKDSSSRVPMKPKNRL